MAGIVFDSIQAILCMGEIGQRELELSPKVIRNFGILFFILSFICPGGISIFLWTPYHAIQTITYSIEGWYMDGERVHDYFTPIVMLAAWTANITIFFRLPWLVALFCIALPWIAYAFLFSFLVSFVPFYLWAIGIAFIHLSRLLKLWPYTAPGPS